MSKTNKVTFGMIAAGMEPGNTTEVQIVDGITVKVVRTLGVKDAFAFVDSIVSTCVSVADEKYIPEGRDFAMRVSVLHWYAGIDLPTGKDLETAYKVVYGTDAFGKVFDVIDQNQFDVLMDAAYEKIKFYCDAMMSTAVQSVSQLTAKMDDMISGSADIMKQFESDDFQKIFKNVMDAVQGSNGDTAQGDAEAPKDEEKPEVRPVVPIGDAKIVRLQRPKPKK